MFVRFLFVFDLLFNLFKDSLVAICLGKSSPTGFLLVLFLFSAVLIVGVPFPFCCLGQDSIVSVPEHCLFIYFIH